MNEQEQDPLVGGALGRYPINRLIGRGGMAVVYQGHHPGLDRDVAVKVLHAHLASDPDFVERFRREAALVAGLNHPNIVRVYDFDVADRRPFMVMELIDGPSLASILHERASAGETLGTGEILRIFPPLCSAIDEAGAHGLVHRDVKPANIMLTSTGEPVLTDYGIAKMAGGPTMTAKGMIIGTPHYMAPEQAEGAGTDLRTDLYALGIVLFEAFAGERPFEGETTAAVLAKQLTAPVPSLLAMRPELPAAVDDVVRTALAKRPDERYASGAELAAALCRALGAEAGLRATLVEPEASPVTVVEPDATPGAVMEPDAPHRLAGATPVARPAPGAPPAARPASTESPRAVPGATPARSTEAAPMAAYGASPGRGARAAPHAPVRAKTASRRANLPWIVTGAVVTAIVVVAVVILVDRGSADRDAAAPTTSLSGDPSTLLDQADALVERGEIDEALNRYDQVLEQDPADAAAHTGAGIARLLRRNTGDAEQHLRAATEADPLNATAFAFLGLTRLAIAETSAGGDLGSAEAVLLEAVRLDPQHGPAHAFLAEVRLGQGRRGEARAEADQALSLAGDNVWVLRSVGYTTGGLGDWASGLGPVLDAVERQPNWAYVQLSAAEVLLRVGRHDEAIAAAQEASNLDQGWRAFALKTTGNAQRAKGDLTAAVESYEASVAMFDGDDGAHFGLGVAQFGLDDFEGALAEFQRAIEIAPGRAAYHDWAAAALERLGRFTEAKDRAQTAVELDPDLESARTRLDQLTELGY